MGANCSKLSRELYRKRKDTKLDLSKRNFKYLPKRIKICTSVQELDASENILIEYAGNPLITPQSDKHRVNERSCNSGHVQ